MPLPFIILMVVIGVIIIAVPLVFFFAFWRPNYRSVIKRAKEIDPSVKTIAEAQFVLQKNVMESINKNNNSENGKDSGEKSE